MKTYFLTLILCAVVLPLFSQSDSTKMLMAEHPIYTCPMHPEVVSDKPGKCPKCGMDLVLKTSSPEAHKMEMGPMHGMDDMGHNQDKEKGNNQNTMKGMGILMGAIMVIVLILAGSR